MPTSASASSRPRTSCLRGHPTLGTAFVLARAAAADRAPARDGAASCRSSWSARGRESSSGGWTAASDVASRSSARRSCSRRSASSGRACRSRCTTGAATSTSSSLARAGGRAPARPDALEQVTSAGVSCFARDGGGWKTRVFVPAFGVPEDPATGSAAGPLAVHLARHGRIAFGEEIEIAQGAEVARPSTLYAQVDGTPERLERVQVGGQRSSSPAASSWSRDGHGRDLRQLDRERSRTARRSATDRACSAPRTRRGRDRPRRPRPRGRAAARAPIRARSCPHRARRGAAAWRRRPRRRSILPRTRQRRAGG